MPSDAETRAHVERMTKDGYTVLERVIEPALVDELADVLLRLEREHDIRPALNGFEGHRTGTAAARIARACGAPASR